MSWSLICTTDDNALAAELAGRLCNTILVEFLCNEPVPTLAPIRRQPHQHHDHRCGVLDTPSGLDLATGRVGPPASSPTPLPPARGGGWGCDGRRRSWEICTRPTSRCPSGLGAPWRTGWTRCSAPARSSAPHDTPDGFSALLATMVLLVCLFGDRAASGDSAANA